MVKSGEQAINVAFQCAMHEQQALWEQKKTRILEQLTAQEREFLLQHSTRTVKARGEMLYLADSELPRVYILDRGYVRFCRITEEGGRLITGFMGPADIFGSVFSATSADDGDDFIEVVREARIIGIESDAFRSVLQHYPAFLLRLIEILEDRKRSLEKRVLSLVTKDVYAQTAEILLALSEKFGESCVTEPHASRDIALTHQEIADLVGIARPTVSKVIGEMLKVGLLRKHHQNLCLYNRAGIQQVAELGQKALG